MTVQFTIANMRRQIFAIDDRVTTHDEKQYNGVQKIFKIPDMHPAKMMINGNMEFENIPIFEDPLIRVYAISEEGYDFLLE
jgi:hypothetical protein